MTEIEIEGETYAVDKLDARTQFHVVRRLAPLMVAMQDETNVLTAISKAVGGMTDEDANYVLDNCLSRAKRKQPTGWAAVMASGGRMMFDDMSMGAMIQVVMAVLKQSKLPDFFPIDLSGSSAPASPALNS